MDTDTLISLLTMALLIALSAYFSATETAFSSLNRTRLRTMADRGNGKAAAALALVEEYDRLLSTILVGNNIVNIAVASMAAVLFVRHFGDIGTTLSTVVVTVVVLIFGEITPKSLAKDLPERFAMFAAPSIRLLIWILTPVNFLFAQWKRLLSHIFSTREDRRMTHEELLVMVEEVEQGGGIDSDEGELLRSAIEFNDLNAGDILTPRVDLEAVPVDAGPDAVAQAFTQSRFSRILVYEGSLDHIIGMIHQKDFYRGTGIVEAPPREIMTVPLFIPASVKISDLLRRLQHCKSHIAVVGDEYGGTLGIVTMEDILEELVGEIWDEHDEVTELYAPMGNGIYRISGAAELSVLRELFDLEYDGEAATVSGWVMEQLQRIPSQGDAFTADGLAVTVTQTDQRRILEVEIRQKLDEPAVPSAPGLS